MEAGLFALLVFLLGDLCILLWEKKGRKYQSEQVDYKLSLKEKVKKKKTLIVLIGSFLFFYYWFSNWDAFELLIKDILQFFS